MQLIHCSAMPAGTSPNGGECGQTTYLIDGSYTLEKGWHTGPAGTAGIAPFYVCPHHVWWYQLRELPAASISPAKSAGDAPAADAGPQDDVTSVGGS